MVSIADQVPVQMKQQLMNMSLVHAYAIEHEAQDIGLATALYMAQKLHCSEQKAPCGVCPSCVAIEKKQHPSITIIAPEGISIKIEHIRELQRAMSYRPWAGYHPVIVIEQAQTMTMQAANALLKSLEDPCGEVLLLLLITNWHALLPTLRSRLQRLSLFGISMQERVGALQEMHPHVSEREIRCIAAIAPTMIRATELAQSSWFAEAVSHVLRLVPIAQRDALQSIVLAQRWIFSTALADEMPTLLDLCTLWVYERMRLCASGGLHECSMQVDTVEGAHTDRPLAYWIELMESALFAQKSLRAHTQGALVLEQFLIACQGERKVSPWFAS